MGMEYMTNSIHTITMKKLNKKSNKSLQLPSQYAASLRSALYCPSAEIKH